MAGDLELAIKIATDAHRGQKDMGGQSYILHPLRVMMSMNTEQHRIVAVYARGQTEPWPRRCLVTGNPWGTDTVREGYVCPCAVCQEMAAPTPPPEGKE